MKKIIGILMTILMVVMTIPISIAAETRVIRTSRLSVSENMEPSSNAAEGWSWDKETKTLTLDNVNIVTEDSTALYIGAISIRIVLKGQNVIKSIYDSSIHKRYNRYGKAEVDSTHGIYSLGGNIVFEGDGSLTAMGGTSSQSSYGICSIYFDAGDITINNASINAIGGNSTSFSSEGLHAADLTINGGTLTASGGNARSRSNGVYLDYGLLTINGGALFATGGSSQDDGITSTAGINLGGSLRNQESMSGNATIIQPPNGFVHQWDTYGRSIFAPGDLTKAAREVVIQSENINRQPMGTPVPAATYVYNEADPGASLALPVDKLNTVTDKSTATKAIQDATTNATAEQKSSATGADLLTLFAEEAVSQAASTTVTGSSITIDQASIQSLQTTANDVKVAAEQALTSGGVAVQRELNADVKFKTNSTASVSITIDPSAANITADNVRIETPNYAVTLSAESIKQNAGDSPLVITITENNAATASTFSANAFGFSSSPNVMLASLGTGNSFLLAAGSATKAKTFDIKFNKPVEENVKVSLPPASGDPNLQAITNSSGNAVGGKYNPVTGMLEAKVNTSDTLTVKENKKNFSDIAGKSQEMQNAINILAAKGIINGTSATTFSPDSTITRAEIAALVVKTLSKLDPNANGGFTDVSRSDWFFGAVGSAKKYGIVNGVGNNMFLPKNVMSKQEILTVSANTLRREMGYRDPADINSLLNTYTDRSAIPSWANPSIALATRENLVVKRTDGKLNGAGGITRGEAAVILYRLFMKIW